MCCVFVDINECQTSPCDVNANCTNIDGGHECTCHIGYEGDGISCTGTHCMEIIMILVTMYKREEIDKITVNRMSSLKLAISMRDYSCLVEELKKRKKCN